MSAFLRPANLLVKEAQGRKDNNNERETFESSTYPGTTACAQVVLPWSIADVIKPLRFRSRPGSCRPFGSVMIPQRQFRVIAKAEHYAAMEQPAEFGRP